MKKIMAALIAAGLWAALCTTAFAVFDDEDIAEMAKKLKEGKGFLEDDGYPGDVQQVSFGAGFLQFRIDFRAEICVVLFRQWSGKFGERLVPQAGQIIPCKIIKKAYPKIGALISWED